MGHPRDCMKTRRSKISNQALPAGGVPMVRHIRRPHRELREVRRGAQPRRERGLRCMVVGRARGGGEERFNSNADRRRLRSGDQRRADPAPPYWMLLRLERAGRAAVRRWRVGGDADV